MWWDAFLSLEVALLSIVALPAVMLADLPQSSVIVLAPPVSRKSYRPVASS